MNRAAGEIQKRAKKKKQTNIPHFKNFADKQMRPRDAFTENGRAKVRDDLRFQFVFVTYDRQRFLLNNHQFSLL